MTYNPVAAVEFFHLVFLDQLGRKVDKRLYALKGGCNLRFFLGSIRYSQDIDLDVKTISPTTLQKTVNAILHSPAMATLLRTRSLEISQMSEPKQTETTQRWKVQLKTQTSLTFPTKIEFSRRELESPVEFEPIDPTILQTYRLHPMFASHYGPLIAFKQKIRALALRTETQARDIWDLYHLMTAFTIERVDSEYLAKACANACSISFGDFKDQVVAFLPADLQEQYQEKMWDQIQLKVVEYLESLQ